MKVIKIILGIIILLTLVFFGTGLVVKEIKYNSEVIINKPIEDVFLIFSKTENEKQWLPEIKAIEVINDNPQKIGSIYKLIVKNKEQDSIRVGQEVIMKQKVLAFIPNEKITYRFNSDVIVRTEDYIFSTIENNTKVTQKTNVRSMSYMLACTFPWFKSKFQEDSQKYLELFKTVAEQ